MKVVVVATSRTITVNKFCYLRFTHKSRLISTRINSTSGSKGPKICANDILIAMVSYISPQDCTIKSINSRLGNYLSTLKLKTQLAQKTSNVLMTPCKSGRKAQIIKKRRIGEGRIPFIDA